MACAEEVAAPGKTFTVHTRTSSQSKAYWEQVRAAVAHADEFPAGGVQLQFAFVVGPQRYWLHL